MKKERGGSGKKEKIPELPLERRAREEAKVIAEERAREAAQYRTRGILIERGERSREYRAAYRQAYQEAYPTEFAAAFRSRLSELQEEESL